MDGVGAKLGQTSHIQNIVSKSNHYSTQRLFRGTTNLKMKSKQQQTKRGDEKLEKNVAETER